MKITSILILLLPVCTTSLLAQNIGIGTNAPTEKLHIANGQIRLSRSASFDNNIIFNMPASQLVGEHQGLKFSLAGIDKAFVGYTSTSMSGNFLRLSGSGTFNNDLVIDANGNVGIGLNTPSSKLHVAGDVLMDATNPIIQLQNDGVSKAFIQLSGDNIRMGTNSGNTAGNFIIRNNGGDRVTVNASGDMSIGQSDPQAKLHINSGSSIEALRLTGNSNTIIRMMTGGTDKANIYATGNDLSITTVQSNGLLRLNGEVYINNTANRTGIGTTVPDEKLHVVGKVKISTGRVLNNDNTNMLPVAWARVRPDGTVATGSSNISFTRGSSGDHKHFTMTVTGVDLRYAAIVATPGTWGTFSPLQTSVIPDSNGKAEIRFVESASESWWIDFYVVVYAN